jgi:hypothetical protein
VTGALPDQEAELGQVTAQRVDQLDALADQEIAGAEDHGGALSLGALGGDEPHRGPLGRLADRLRVGHVVLLPLHERLDVGRRDQPHLMAEPR